MSNKARLRGLPISLLKPNPLIDNQQLKYDIDLRPWNDRTLSTIRFLREGLLSQFQAFPQDAILQGERAETQQGILSQSENDAFSFRDFAMHIPMKFSSKLASSGKFSSGVLIYECYKAQNLGDMQNLIKFMLDTHIIYPNCYSQLDLLCDFADYADYFKRENAKFIKIIQPQPKQPEKLKDQPKEEEKKTKRNLKTLNLDTLDLDELKPITPPFSLKREKKKITEMTKSPFETFMEKKEGEDQEKLFVFGQCGLDSLRAQNRQINPMDRKLPQNLRDYFGEKIQSSFEMNPHIDETKILIFDSNFQCGNLEQVRILSTEEYDLLMRVDTNTKGNTQWFYFAVTNTKQGHTVRFNIKNCTKNYSMFRQGMGPAVFSEVEAEQEGTGWMLGGSKFVKYTKNRIVRYTYQVGPTIRREEEEEDDDEIYDDEEEYKGAKRKKCYYYTLSFYYTFKYSDDRVYFAYSLPYSLSKLTSFLKTSETILADQLESTVIKLPQIAVGLQKQIIPKTVKKSNIKSKVYQSGESSVEQSRQAQRKQEEARQHYGELSKGRVYRTTPIKTEFEDELLTSVEELSKARLTSGQYEVLEPIQITTP